MHDIENTLIGTTGAGLSVEQRKRLNIGVELVSKPSILYLLGRANFRSRRTGCLNIVRFLRKFADVGRAVLVTIHRPSAQLFAQFDSLLLLAKGGKMVYFGEIGENGGSVKEYFARHGVRDVGYRRVRHEFEGHILTSTIALPVLAFPTHSLVLVYSLQNRQSLYFSLWHRVQFLQVPGTGFPLGRLNWLSNIPVWCPRKAKRLSL